MIGFESPNFDFAVSVVQSAAAGYALHTLLGPSLEGKAFLGIFLAAPICSKVISKLTQKKGALQNPTVNKLANGSGHVLRIATKGSVNSAHA